MRLKDLQGLMSGMSVLSPFSTSEPRQGESENMKLKIHIPQRQISVIKSGFVCYCNLSDGNIQSTIWSCWRRRKKIMCASLWGKKMVGGKLLGLQVIKYILVKCLVVLVLDSCSGKEHIFLERTMGFSGAHLLQVTSHFCC